MHGRDPATDDAGAEAAQLDEVVSEGMIQSPRQTVTVHNKLEFLLTESEKNKKDLDPCLFFVCFLTQPAFSGGPAPNLHFKFPRIEEGDPQKGL